MRVQNVLQKNYWISFVPPRYLTSTIFCKECQKQYSSNFHVKWNNPRYIRLLTIVRSCSSKTPPDTTGSNSQSENQKSSQDEKEEPKDTKRSKIVKVRKKKIIDYTYTENIFISPVRAMDEYLLTPADLENIAKYSRRSPYAFEPGPKIVMFRRADVENISIKKWGSIENATSERIRRIKLEKLGLRKFHLFEPDHRERTYSSGDEKPFILTETDDYKNYEDINLRRKFFSTGSGKVVGSAIVINFANSLLKGVAWLYTGSYSMFSEMVHSAADTLNQIILGLGLYQSYKKPDPGHPYGYTNLRHVSSLVSGVGIFFLGTGFSIYHGIQGIFHPEEMGSLMWGIMVLAGSLISEGGTLLVAINQVRKSSKRKGIKFWQYVWRGNDPNVTVVLLEDLAAVFGVTIAASCMTLTHFTNNPLYDAAGSIAIGGLLGVVATFIIYTNTMALLGRSIPMDMKHNISVDLENDRMIRSLHDVKATEMGGQVKFKAEIDFDGREITRAYLYKLDLEQLLKDMQALKTSGEAEDFMLKHGEKLIDSLGEEVDRIENLLKTKYPDIRHVDLEAL